MLGFDLATTVVLLVKFYYGNGETFFENAATVSFSGSNYGSSTGAVYSTTIDNSEQWGRLFYRMDSIDATGDNYVHVTFMWVDNGIGEYEYTNGDTTTTTQTMRIVDSVGSTLKMQQTPTQSMQYLLNMDTAGADGELNRDTDYNYYYKEDYTCMEWYTNSDNQEIYLYEDGELTYQVNNDLTFTGPSTGAAITFTIPQSLDIKIGMYTYNGISVSGDFKDVIIGDQRIGCDDSTTATGTTGGGDDDDDETTEGPDTADTTDNSDNNNNGDTTDSNDIDIIINTADTDDTDDTHNDDDESSEDDELITVYQLSLPLCVTLVEYDEEAVLESVEDLFDDGYPNNEYGIIGFQQSDDNDKEWNITLWIESIVYTPIFLSAYNGTICKVIVDALGVPYAYCYLCQDVTVVQILREAYDNNDSSSNNGDNDGDVLVLVLIIVICVVGVILIAGIILFLCKRRNGGKHESDATAIHHGTSGGVSGAPGLAATQHNTHQVVVADPEPDYGYHNTNNANAGRRPPPPRPPPRY